MTRRIVVCDDEPHIVRAISLKFSRAGFEVHSAFDTVSGWNLIRRVSPELLITDYTMPGDTGADLVRRIRKDEAFADLPVIMLTARGFELADDASFMEELKLSAIAVKPFSPRELVSMVCDILGCDLPVKPNRSESEFEIPVLMGD